MLHLKKVTMIMHKWWKQKNKLAKGARRWL
jgi:hypothetical protein